MAHQAFSRETEQPSRASTPVPIRSTESELPERLRLAIGDEPVTAFGRRCGIGEATLRKYFKGTLPNIENLIAIADAANVSIEWLAAGRGPKQRGASATPPAPPAESTVNVEDLARLTLAIEAIEEGLGPTRYKLTANRYAQLVAAVYDLLADMDQKSNVLKFIKLAA